MLQQCGRPGLLLVLDKVVRGNATRLVPATALALGLLYLVGGTWGFRLLDPQKNYRRWTAAVQPLIQGREVFYWQTIRSGVMVYTDHLMPEVRTAGALERMNPEARLVIVFMVQILPNTTDLGRKFPTLVYQALVEP